METVTLTKDQAGCWLDNHRGHYITRDAIELAKSFGFMYGEFAQFALNMYEDYNHGSDFPHEEMQELCDEAVAWLNSGQQPCVTCDGDKYRDKLDENAYTGKDGFIYCKTCSGTGRGPRIPFQNFPPIVPEDYVWSFEDGDFGLWKYDDEGEFVIDQ